MTFSYLAHKGDFVMLQLVNLSNDPTDTEGLLGAVKRDYKISCKLIIWMALNLCAVDLGIGAFILQR